MHQENCGGMSTRYTTSPRFESHRVVISHQLSNIHAALHTVETSVRFAAQLRWEISQSYSAHARVFWTAGPSVWNSLPDSLRDPAHSLQMKISVG